MLLPRSKRVTIRSNSHFFSFSFFSTFISLWSIEEALQPTKKLHQNLILTSWYKVSGHGLLHMFEVKHTRIEIWKSPLIGSILSLVDSTKPVIWWHWRITCFNRIKLGLNLFGRKKEKEEGWNFLNFFVFIVPLYFNLLIINIWN